MMAIDEACSLRDKVDELAMCAATVEDWRLVDARLFHAMMEGQHEITALQAEMIALVKSSKPNWCWFETHAKLRELREVLDDLRVLRMCVQSRIYELECGAVQAQ
jgi:hypothetical protein